MKMIDDFLNKITMYRLLVYELGALLGIAMIFGYFHIMPYNPVYLGLSIIFLFLISWGTNTFFARIFKSPTNPESTWITALILALIITPPVAFLDSHYLALAFWAAAWAIASKYILAIRKKHIFNPAAFGVAITAFVLGLSASWWVGTAVMAPFVLTGGLLIVRKIRRFDLWWSFMAVFGLGIVAFSIVQRLNILDSLSQSFLYAPAFFFSTIMLTEPLTAPPTKFLRILYGALVGFLFLPFVGVGSFYFTPELALLAGNVFVYFVSPKYKLNLTLKQVDQLSSDVFEFTFNTEGYPVSYKPGQYMEWTLPHQRPDNRSVRRYLTLSSSPTEPDMKIGVKFYRPSSTFKRALLEMPIGTSLAAGQLGGDFTLPKNRKEKLVFISGGIGVTPFSSMMRYLLDKNDRRDIVHLYINKNLEDVPYVELFDRAEYGLGIRTVHAELRLSQEEIRKHIPDYSERTFYISGPQGMVTNYRQELLSMGVQGSKIKTDYFPGLA